MRQLLMKALKDFFSATDQLTKARSCALTTHVLLLQGLSARAAVALLRPKAAPPGMFAIRAL